MYLNNNNTHRMYCCVYTANRCVKPPLYYVVPISCIWLYSIKRKQATELVIYLWILRRNPNFWYPEIWCTYGIITEGKIDITEYTRSSKQLTSVLKVEPILFC